jgi:hypothetical protein
MYSKQFIVHFFCFTHFRFRFTTHTAITDKYVYVLPVRTLSVAKCSLYSRSRELSLNSSVRVKYIARRWRIIQLKLLPPIKLTFSGFENIRKMVKNFTMNHTRQQYWHQQQAAGRRSTLRRRILKRTMGLETSSPNEGTVGGQQREPQPTKKEVWTPTKPEEVSVPARRWGAIHEEILL